MNKSRYKLDKRDIELFKEIIQKLIDDGIPLEKIQNQIESGIFFDKIFLAAKNDWSKMAYETMQKKSTEYLAWNRNDKQEFEKYLNQMWKQPFDLLEILIGVSQEIGHNFNNECRREAVKNNNLVFEALIRLQGRACQVSQEILTLMQSGYPDGANARWRTLHEIVVISQFINTHGQNVAEKYLLYDAIESFQSVKIYIDKPDLLKKHNEILKFSLLTDQDIQDIIKTKNQLCAKYGDQFAVPYGWAADIIPGPNFSKLEEHVKLDHLRPYYKMANIQIHAGPKGIFYHLTSANRNIIIAGPGNLGMADPGSLTAISLLQMNVTLLLLYPNIRRFAEIGVLFLMEQEIKNSFKKIHDTTMNNFEISNDFNSEKES